MVCVCIMGVDVGECGWGGLVSGGDTFTIVEYYFYCILYLKESRRV
jgi:hypothetical protein